MAISDESRKEFLEKVKPVKDQIASLVKKEQETLLSLRGKPDSDVVAGKIFLSQNMILVSTLYININNVSVEMLETKNNDALNDARKAIYKAVIYLEDIVSNVVDCPYSDLEPKIARLEGVDVAKRLDLIRRLGLVIQLLVDAFGENSKWKESFVELRGRHAVVAKNMMDMKQGVKAYFEPGEPFHDETVLYIRLVRSLLDKSATEYRDRYELASKRIDDMRMAVNLLIALRRIAMLMSDAEESENIRKKALVWKTKMETDSKKGVSK